MSSKKQLLDPLGTLCKIISLYFKDLDTKISIHNHVLSLQEPGNYQPFIRMVNGDGRENISEIYYAIIRIIKWYIINETDEQYKVDEDDIRQLIHYACIALSKLQETYEHGNVVLAIQFYINLFNDAINGKFDESKLPEHIVKKDKMFDNLIDYNKLKGLWTSNKVKIIRKLYDECFDTRNNEDMTLREKQILLNCHVESVNEFLRTNDDEFQNLILNTTKG